MRLPSWHGLVRRAKNVEGGELALWEAPRKKKRRKKKKKKKRKKKRKKKKRKIFSMMTSKTKYITAA